MINTPSAAQIDLLRKFYEEAFQKLAADQEAPPVEVVFYPYIGINHTIRVRGGKAFVRLAEICRDMPLAYHRALAHILVAKLLRKRVPAGADEMYSAYANSPEMRERAVHSRRERGRKVLSGSDGEIYDLDEIFERLNRTYFRGTIERPTLSWSAKRTYRILGHHDSTHKTIVVSRSLDSADVPRYVVDYVLFHEMLHIHHPTVHHNGRRYNHTAAFRRDERKFAHYEQAERWIENNVRKLKRRAKARKK